MAENETVIVFDLLYKLNILLIIVEGESEFLLMPPISALADTGNVDILRDLSKILLSFR